MLIIHCSLKRCKKFFFFDMLVYTYTCGTSIFQKLIVFLSGSQCVRICQQVSFLALCVLQKVTYVTCNIQINKSVISNS